MYRKKLNASFSKTLVVASICIMALLAGCVPTVEPAFQVPPPPTPVDSEIQGQSTEIVSAADDDTALPPDSPDDMSRLLAHAEPFTCEFDADDVQHCVANAPDNERGFAARIYVKVPDQGYPTDVVLLPIFPPAPDAEDERDTSDIRSFFGEQLILNKADVETAFKPAWLISNFAVVKVDENGVFSGLAEDALSEFEPAIEVRLEFNREQLQRAADAGMGMPRFGYWSYAPIPQNRKWVEFTPDREYDNRALLEIFRTDQGATRGMGGVEILDSIEEVATVDQALELLEQPSTRGVGEDSVRAIVIRDTTGLADKFEQFVPAFTRGLGGSAEARISFVVTVASWEDQALGGFP